MQGCFTRTTLLHWRTPAYFSAYLLGLWTSYLRGIWPSADEYLALLVLLVCVALKRYWLLSVYLLAILIGYTSLADRLSASLPLTWIGQDIWLVGEIQQREFSKPKTSTQFGRIRIQVLACQPVQENKPPDREIVHTQTCPLVGQSLYLSLYDALPQSMVVGQVWGLRTRLKPVRAYAHPASQKYALGADLVRGYVKTHAQSAQLYPQESTHWLTGIRQQGLQLLAAESQKKPELATAYQVLAALLLGEQQGLAQTTWTLFSATGSVHLLVVSGLHLGLLATAFLLLGRVLQIRRDTYVYSLWIALVLAVTAAYAGISGWQVPVQRAWGTLVFALVLITWVQQRINPWWAWGILLLGMLTLNPSLSARAGFWLSFVSVALIMWTYQHQTGTWRLWLSLQMRLFWGLMPLLLLFQLPVSLWGPLVNLLLVPLMGMFLPLCFLALGLAALGETALLVFAAHSIDWVLQVLHGLQTVPLSVWQDYPVQMPWVVLIALAALPTGMLALRGVGVMAAVLAYVLTLVPVTGQQKLASGEVHLHLFDVGQGLSLLLETQHHRLLYDVGIGYPSGFAPIKDYLPELKALDAVVLSHGDRDHSGAWPVLAPHVRPQVIWHGMDMAPPQGQVRQRACQGVHTWVWDDVEFTLIGPMSAHQLSANDTSCMLLVSTPWRQHILVTGDVSRAYEYQRLALAGKTQQLEADKISVWVAGHHGSRTSTHPSLLRRWRPEYLAYSHGWRSSYGHPHGQVVQHAAALGIRQVSTSDLGRLTWSFYRQGIRFQSQRSHYLQDASWQGGWAYP
ncbi:competence protein ComEC [Allopseudospirillum japonicum]|uniref:Competence protein ComEC n=1 Tax=Allopseudospirillum japonicum TaxID=64971 RepID=A0A1H6T9H4_9GAMM|nr:DNA internalization-related competence protein ComEC/Rec2 [Allopseudospirillum japonicum]SEI76743.1 competence protein ComEC [Allopseudospirillum japonicum]